MQNVTIRWRLS